MIAPDLELHTLSCFDDLDLLFVDLSHCFTLAPYGHDI